MSNSWYASNLHRALCPLCGLDLLMTASIAITIVIDFMCPWSFIGLKSLDAAMGRWQQQHPGTADLFILDFVPFEFDPPGTYPAAGTDWAEYCRGYSPAKARYLLEEKLPAAFELGARLGIQFDLKRRIVGTEVVNTALVAAAEAGGGDKARAFALRMLREHFELLRDPNDPALLAAALAEAGADERAVRRVLAPGAARAAQNAALTERGRGLSGGSVPKFVVACSGGGDAAAAPGSPTSPEYFERLFTLCAERGGSDAAAGTLQVSQDEL